MATSNVKPAVTATNAPATPVVEPVVENPTTSSVDLTDWSFMNVVKKLVSSGCKRLNSVKVKNVNFEDLDNYTRVSITLGTPIEGYVSNDNGVTYELGKTNVIFVSLFAIAATFKENEDLAWMANALIENHTALNLIINGGTIDIVQQHVPAGTEYVNPFSRKEDVEASVYDHDIIINHIVGFNLGRTGQRMADKLADKLLGF